MSSLSPEAGRQEKVRLRARHYRTGIAEEFLFENDQLLTRQQVADDSEARLLFGPGLVDLQCNGYAGVDFNHPNTTPEQIQYAIRCMWRHGCTTVLPTVITAEKGRIEHLLRTLVIATASGEFLRSAPGFHLEGPFISREDGARGAHPREHVREPDLELFRDFQRAAEGRLRMVTVAPEVEGALAFIAELRRDGVIPAIGHTMADAHTVTTATDRGAMMSTHLGNGCPKTLDRHVNPIFAQLGEPRLAASVIPDGVHIPREVLYSIARVKGREGSLIVTDAMAAAGAPPGTYTLGDLSLEIGADRIVRQPGSSYLAGSALTMNQAVLNFRALAGVSFEDSWDAASELPAQLLSGIKPEQHVDPGVIIADVTDNVFHVRAAFRGKNVLWLEPDQG